MKITIECTQAEKDRLLPRLVKDFCFLECPKEDISCLECMESLINWKIKENKRGNNSRTR